MLLLLLLLVASPAAVAQPRSDCRAVFFDATVSAGQSYARAVGGGLELRLMPQQFADPAAGSRRLDGWTIVVATPATAGAPAVDRIWPVNLPLRFNPWQDIGTSYGVTAAQKLSRDITYRLAWRNADYQRISRLAADALWPYSAPDPDDAGARYLTALQRLDAAELRLHPVNYELSDDGRSIRRLALTVTVIAPREFGFADALAPKPAACPPRQQ